VSFRQTMSEQGPVIRGALGAIAQFRETAEEIPAVSQAMNTAKRRVVGSLDKVIGALEKHEALTVRVIDLIDGQLERHDSGATPDR